MSMAVAGQTMAQVPVLTRERTRERPAALPALTGLRFVAALGVVVVHFGADALRGAPAWLRAVAANGNTGVSLFFVLSGFILAYTYLERGGRMHTTARAFWLARLARIYPVYLLALVFGAAPALRDWAHPGGGPLVLLLPTLLLVQAWIPYGNAWNGPGWSLSAEAFFYLLFPRLAPAVARLSTRRILTLCAALWLLALLGPLAYVALNPDHVPTTWAYEPGFWYAVLPYNPLLRLPEFLMGVGTGVLYARCGRPAPGALAPLAGLAIVVVLAGAALLPQIVLNNGLLAPLFCALIWGLAVRATGERARAAGLLAGLLAARPLVLLGEASYALYLIHVSLWRYVARPGQNPASLSVLVLYMAGAALLSVLIYRMVEQPARRAIRARLR